MVINLHSFKLTIMNNDIVLVELFAGSGHISEYARSLGIKTFTIDIEKKFSPDWTKNILEAAALELLEKLEQSLDWTKAKKRIFWASVPCQGFTKLMIAKNWESYLIKKNTIRYKPKSKKAYLALELLNKAIELKDACKPDLYYFENPVGVLRHLPQIRKLAIRKTVSYMDYGFDYLKPTDIFTNNWNFNPIELKWNKKEKGNKKSFNNKNAYQRSLIPPKLIKCIVDSCL